MNQLMPSGRFAGMLPTLLFLLSLVALASASVIDDSLVTTDCSFGDVYQFSLAGCSASIENAGKTPLTLSIKAVQPGNSVKPETLALAAHARADLSLRVLTENISGSVSWTYRIDGAGDEPHFVRASGFVNSVLDIGHPRIDFGAVDLSALPVMRTLALTSSLDPSVRVTRILSSPSIVNALIGADAKSLTVEMRPDVPWGSFDRMIKIGLDSAQQKQAWVQVTGSVAGDVGPEKNPYWLGEVTWKPKRTLTIPLIDKGGRDFSIGAVTSEDFAATYDNAPCEPAHSGCHNLLIKVSNTQPAGFFKSNLDVSLLDRKKHLLVEIWGVLGDRPKPGEVAAPPTITKIPVPKSRGQDNVTAVPPLRTEADPPGAGPLLTWTITQQQSVHGFQILRGDSADGPFELMEPHVVPKLDNGRGPVAYRWRDTSAVKAHTYWYYIVVLYSSGDRQPLTRPQKTLAN